MHNAMLALHLRHKLLRPPPQAQEEAGACSSSTAERV
jgi:hypothetical protein